MMKTLHIIFLLFFIFFSTKAISSICRTVEVCQNYICQCTVSADNYYDRKFYFEFSNIEKNNRYQCKFTSSLGLPDLLLDESIFPVGVKFQYPIPLQEMYLKNEFLIEINTQDMLVEKDNVIIKYRVAASDITTNVYASCVKLL